MKIVIWTGAAWEPWGSRSLDDGGIGGSETAAVNMSRRLALLGHEVVMVGDHQNFEGHHNADPYNHEARYGEIQVDYVDYRRAIRENNLLNCDVFVASRDKRAHRLEPKCRAKILWVHDVNVGDDWENELLSWDRIYCLSEWHRDYFLGVYPHVPPEVVHVTRNGIDVKRYCPEMPWNPPLQPWGLRATPAVKIAWYWGNTLLCCACGFNAGDAAGQLAACPSCGHQGEDSSRTVTTLSAKKKPKFVWSSSPDRGLDVMLDVWPRVKAFRPDAELHVYYGFENWRKLNAQNKRGLTIIDYMEKRMREAEPQGVHYHGRVGQRELALAQLEAMVWAYPTNFSETSCITAMEAQAAGAIPLTTNLAALAETVKVGRELKGRTLLEPHAKQARYQDEFVATLKVNLNLWEWSRLNDAVPYLAEQARSEGLKLGWDGVAKAWLVDFAELLGDGAQAEIKT